MCWLLAAALATATLATTLVAVAAATLAAAALAATAAASVAASVAAAIADARPRERCGEMRRGACRVQRLHAMAARWPDVAYMYAPGRPHPAGRR